jgi:hypothetical protein
MNRGTMKKVGKKVDELSFYQGILKSLSEAKTASPQKEQVKDPKEISSPGMVIEHYLDENGRWIPG